MKNIEFILAEIIDDKYKKLEKDKINKQNLFWKIDLFEGNAIGQIGENFVRVLLKNNNIMPNNKENTHDEYDIKVNNVKVEIKTARLGKNKTFQFNGINPKYNYSYIILLGLAADSACYNIITDKIKYIHKERRYTVSVDDKVKSLVSMNPGNQVNYKLTLNQKHLLPITEFEEKLLNLFK